MPRHYQFSVEVSTSTHSIVIGQYDHLIDVTVYRLGGDSHSNKRVEAQLADAVYPIDDPAVDVVYELEQLAFTYFGRSNVLPNSRVREDTRE